MGRGGGWGYAKLINVGQNHLEIHSPRDIHTLFSCWLILLVSGHVCVLQEEIEVGEVRLKRSAELKADEKRVEEVMQKISQSK